MDNKFENLHNIKTTISEATELSELKHKDGRPVLIYALDEADNAAAMFTEIFNACDNDANKITQLVSAQDADNKNILHYLADNDNDQSDLIKLVLAKLGENKNAVLQLTDNSGNSPLLSLFSAGEPDNIKAFVEKIDDFAVIRSGDIISPLQTALDEADEAVTMFSAIFEACDNDANKIKQFVSAQDADNKNILHYLADNDNDKSDLITLVLAKLGENKNAVLQLTDDSGNSPLLSLFSAGEPDNIKAFVEKIDDFASLIAAKEIDAIASAGGVQLNAILAAFSDNDAKLMQILEKVDSGTNLLHKLVNDDKSAEVQKIFHKITDNSHLKKLLEVTVNNETLYDLDVEKGVLTADEVSSYFTDMLNKANGMECSNKITCEVRKAALVAIKVHTDYADLVNQRTNAITTVDNELQQYTELTSKEEADLMKGVGAAYEIEQQSKTISQIKTSIDQIELKHDDKQISPKAKPGKYDGSAFYRELINANMQNKAMKQVLCQDEEITLSNKPAVCAKVLPNVQEKNNTSNNKVGIWKNDFLKEGGNDYHTVLHDEAKSLLNSAIIAQNEKANNLTAVKTTVTELCSDSTYSSTYGELCTEGNVDSLFSAFPAEEL